MVTVQGGMAEFVFYRPQARQVHLVGDFNHWRGNQVPMVRLEDGRWMARLSLPAGTHKFRYCADGEWFTDYAAFGVEFGPFGPDSLVRIDASQALEPAPRSNVSDVIMNPAAEEAPAAEGAKQKVA